MFFCNFDKYPEKYMVNGGNMDCNNCGAEIKNGKVCGTCGVTVNTKPRTPNQPAKNAMASKSRSLAISTQELSDGIEPNRKADVDAQLKQIRSWLYTSLSVLIILVISGLVYVAQTQKAIEDLNSDVSYLESEISFVDSSVSQLSEEMQYFKEWGYDEVNKVVGCVNEFIDAWATRGLAFYCRSPLAP